MNQRQPHIHPIEYVLLTLATILVWTAFYIASQA